MRDRGHRCHRSRSTSPPPCFTRPSSLPPRPSPAHLAGRGLEGEDLARHVGHLLLRRGLAVRVDRVVKKPPPGSKKLVKFPRKITAVSPELSAVR